MSYKLRHGAALIRMGGGDAALSEDESICTQLVCEVDVLATGLLEPFGAWLWSGTWRYPPSRLLSAPPAAGRWVLSAGGGGGVGGGSGQGSLDTPRGAGSSPSQSPSSSCALWVLKVPVYL